MIIYVPSPRYLWIIAHRVLFIAIAMQYKQYYLFQISLTVDLFFFSSAPTMVMVTLWTLDRVWTIAPQSLNDYPTTHGWTNTLGLCLWNSASSICTPIYSVSSRVYLRFLHTGGYSRGNPSRHWSYTATLVQLDLCTWPSRCSASYFTWWWSGARLRIVSRWDGEVCTASLNGSNCVQCVLWVADLVCTCTDLCLQQKQSRKWKITKVIILVLLCVKSQINLE